ncbi:MAG: GAF domain-containing sensor histidine kinase [Anaerolineae bacterium]|nr:GAF domain-containing sensor histidine kinase [Anaerolineae bacterium]
MLKYLDDPDETPESGNENDDVTAQPSDAYISEDDVSDDFDDRTLPVEVDPQDMDSVLKQKIVGLERRISYLERIVKVGHMLNSVLSLEPLLQIIVQSATELTDTEACSIMLIDKNTGELRFSESTGGLTDALRELIIPLDGSIGGWVVRQARPLLIRDVKSDPRWHDNVDEALDFETRSILGVPLQVRNKVIGVLEVVNKNGDEGFNEDDIQIATTLAAQAAIAIENARLLDELQQAYRDLSEVDQLKNDFVSIASHELRTPLSVILGYATFLKDNVSGQASEQLEIVLSSAMKLRSLIDDMVNVRHIQAEEIELSRSIFSLKQLVVDLIDEFSDIISGKNLILTKKFVPDNSPLNIDADRQKVYLILANLISNAIKFTPEKGRIHINLELKGHKYWLNVIDTGIGIASEDYERIFDQFYQVEPPLTRKYQGMGLGLAITKGMVEIHKGRVWVESVVGKGSNFVVVLPSAPDVQDT